MFLYILAFTTILFFSSTLSFGFISDDFFYLSISRLGDVISPHPGFYHYIPVFWGLIWFIKNLFGYNPLPFHFAAILLHLVNILIFYKITPLFLKDKVSRYLATVVFAFFFAHYEIIYWVTGISTTAMITFYLLGFLTFAYYTKLKNSSFLYLYYLLFTIAILTHEYAISLPFVALFYWIFFSKERIKLSAIAKIFALPLPVVSFLFLIKLKFTSLLIVQNPTVTNFISSEVKSILYLLFPFPDLIDFLPNGMLIVLFLIIICLIIIKIRKNKELTFLFIWLFITILVFSVTSLPQARYLSLSVVPAILLLFRFFPVKTLISFPTIYFSLVLISSILFLNRQKYFWEKSSKITRNVLSDVKSLFPKYPEGKNLYFVNLPDSVNGPPWNAYVFRNGLDHALEIEYGIKLKPISYLRTVDLDGKVREDQFVKVSDLIELSKFNTVFIYNPQRESVNLLK